MVRTLLALMLGVVSSAATAASADAIFANGFEIPPHVISVSPSRITIGACTTTELTISGTAFATAATVWYLAPSGTLCAGATTDATGQLRCPLTVDTAAETSITAHFPSCPAPGPYPLVVINPGGLADYYYSIEITTSLDGSLNTGAFQTQQNRLETPRWKHAVEFGFDSFSNSIVYVAGGQDAAGNVLGSVEYSVFDAFGTPGPFAHLEQFGNPNTPRVANDLVAPREGATLARVGKSLFSIGGTTLRSDVITPVAASNVVERALILGNAEMPSAMQPTVVGATGLPAGIWYYRVAAVGPWGESLAENEVVAANKSGRIQVCWVPPQTPGTISYNIYRSLASDGQPGTEAALAYEAAGTCFTDDGVEKHTPAPGNAHGTVVATGSLAAGTYSYRISAVVPLAAGGTFETYAGYVTSTTITASDVSAGNRTINVAWDSLPAAGVTYRVFRLDPVSGFYKLLTGAGALTANSFNDGGAFDPSGATPRIEVTPLPTGSLSKWNAAMTPQLLQPREGLDSVVIALDPAASSNLVARILVAGGRNGTGGVYTYRTSAESLGIYADGTTDGTWLAETPVFTHARAYYALVTTQNRNTTPFPGQPNPPPVGSDPVYLVAAMGDDAFALTNNQGRSDFEACNVELTTGHLACGATWVVQSQNDPNATFGADAVLYFSYLYPFYGIQRETLGATATSITFLTSAIGRFLLLDLTAVLGGQVLSTRQSVSTNFVVHRAYYQMTRLLTYVYVVGGYAEAHTENSISVPAGPTGLVERHQQ